MSLTASPASRLALYCSLLCTATVPAAAKDGLSLGRDGLTLASGEAELTLGGRLHMDAVTYDDEVTSGSDADVRRARIELSARLGDTVRLRLDREFANTDGWRNVWMSISPGSDIEIKGGNFTVPFSLEDIQSSNKITFVERSPVSALAPGFGLGASAGIAKANWTLSAGYFDDALDDADGRSRERGRGFAGRATYLPMKSRAAFLHLGLAYERRSLRSSETLRLSQGLGSNLAPGLIATGAIVSPETMNNIGAELAYGRKSLQLQGQYVRSRISRNLAPTLNYAGWYGQVSWMLTGERYGYSQGSGTPSGPQIGKKGNGLELAARYGELDLDDAARDGGKAMSLAVGATWYIARNLRVMANYVKSQSSDITAVADRNADRGVVRFQIAF